MRPTPIRPGPARSALLVLSLLLLWPSVTARAQQNDDTPEPPPRVTDVYVLQNARIVQAPGRTIERGSVLIRDGRIVDVGPSVSVPFDAEVIPADTLTVYPGFIDGLSHTGIPEPRNGDGASRERVERPGDPPDDRAGIQPGRDVRAFLEADEKSIADWRAVGVTLSHVVPRGRMLPGQGALVLLGGDDPHGMVFRGPASLFAQMQGARGVYPATIMGVMAVWRDLYRNAERYRTMRRRFENEPASHPRPAYDPTLEALDPVLSGSLPVFFGTESAKNALRAMDLADELGFPLLLGGVQEGWMLTDVLAASGTPVFFSLDLPDPLPGGTAGDVDSTDTSLSRTESHADVEEEVKRLRERRREALARHLRAPADWRAAGIRFGFSTSGAEADEFRSGLRRLIEHGLSEDDALAALTTDAAALLGIEGSAGSVDPGMTANLVVTTGPYFDEDSHVRLVFVDGKKYVYEPERASRSGANPAGTWRYTLQMPDSVMTGMLVLMGRASSLTGTITGPEDSDIQPVDDPAVQGDTLSFSFSVRMQGAETGAKVRASIEEDALRGTLDAGRFGSFPFEAVRTADP